MNNFYDIFFDSLLDALKDTTYLIPFLFFTYVLMEFIEHKTTNSTQNKIKKSGRFGPFFGALLGIVPQCGFSAAGSTLYAGRVITLGTLTAIFLSTSDEMLPIFIAKQIPASTTLAILAFKLLVGMIVGFLVDFVFSKIKPAVQKFRIHELCMNDKCNCCENCEFCKNEPESVYDHFDDEHEALSHEHNHSHATTLASIFKSSLTHTCKVVLFIFAITLVITFCIEIYGEENIKSLFAVNNFLSIFISSIFGLIPNCSASIVIADLWTDGLLSNGAMISGLLVAAGIGYLVLFRTNKKSLRENLTVVAIMLSVSILSGILIELFVG